MLKEQAIIENLSVSTLFPSVFEKLYNFSFLLQFDFHRVRIRYFLVAYSNNCITEFHQIVEFEIFRPKEWSNVSTFTVRIPNENYQNLPIHWFGRFDAVIWNDIVIFWIILNNCICKYSKPKEFRKPRVLLYYTRDCESSRSPIRTVSFGNKKRGSFILIYLVLLSFQIGIQESCSFSKSCRLDP